MSVLLFVPAPVRGREKVLGQDLLFFMWPRRMNLKFFIPKERIC